MSRPLTGIGLATTVIVFLMNIYYIVVLAWDVVYLAMSFKARLPWSHCDNDWNTARCRTTFGIDNDSFINTSSVNDTLVSASRYVNATLVSAGSRYVDPVIEFWE